MQDACPFPTQNPPHEEIENILRRAKVIAVVGLSDKQDRDSYRVAAYLKAHGYRVIPVNPRLAQVFDEKAYPDLTGIPGPVDIVDVFRHPEAVPGIVEEAIRIGAKVIWLQLGIVHEAAAERARKAGLQVVMNRCIMVEHKKYFKMP